MKEVFRELREYRQKIAIVFAMVIGSSLSNLALPMYLSKVINEAIPAQSMQRVFALGAVMLFFVLTATGCSLAVGYFAAHVSVGFGKKLRQKVFAQVQYFSPLEFDQISTSSLITRTNNDITQVQTFVNMLLRMSLLAPIMALGGIVLAFQKDAKMSMILLFSMPILLLFVFLVAKRVMPLSTKLQEQLDMINLIIREKLTGVRVARTFGTQLYEEERFEEVNRLFMQNSIDFHTTMAVSMPGFSLLIYATIVALLAFAGKQLIAGATIPIGDVIAVIQYVIQILISVLMLSIVFFVYPRASVSAERIKEVLTLSPKIQNPVQAIAQTQAKGHVVFQNVGFSFPNAKSAALEGITFEAKPGEITAIIGSTGCGKSTLINLIPRFYDVSEGSVMIDGVDVRTMDLADLRCMIGLVPQKSFLFKGSIADNIRVGAKDSSEELVRKALSVAQADFVEEKEGALEFELTQGGSNVSGGQRQRLAIARAIVRQPKIYIFDDSFSALDYKTDAALRKALLQEAKDATVLLVAQRVSTIQNADRIIVLESGRCVGNGTHEQLLQDCSVYREIVSSQLGKEEA